MSFGMVMWLTPRRVKRSLDGFIDDIVDVARTHDALVEFGDVHVELVEVHILLVVRADQVVESVPGDRQHRLAVAFRVVESVQ